jgi:hypothetical protein
MSEQPALVLTPTTYAQVALLAVAWNVAPATAVQRLVEHFQHRTTSAADPQDPAGDEDRVVAVYAIYARLRIEGHYTPRTRALTITHGPGLGPYKSPSGATTAVVRALRPGVTPNRSGWDFWIVDDTGERLRTLRHTR